MIVIAGLLVVVTRRTIKNNVAIRADNNKCFFIKENQVEVYDRS